MDMITKITGVYPINRALNELQERVYALESQINNLTKSHSELQANYWETESKVYDYLEARNQLLEPDASITPVNPKQKSRTTHLG